VACLTLLRIILPFSSFLATKEIEGAAVCELALNDYTSSLGLIVTVTAAAFFLSISIFPRLKRIPYVGFEWLRGHPRGEKRGSSAMGIRLIIGDCGEGSGRHFLMRVPVG